MTHSQAIGFDAVIHDTDVYLAFTRTTTWSHDPTYGSDADGNRGIPMTCVDEDRASDILITVGDSLATDPIERWPALAQAACLEAVQAYLAAICPDA